MILTPASREVLVLFAWHLPRTPTEPSAASTAQSWMAALLLLKRPDDLDRAHLLLDVTMDLLSVDLDHLEAVTQDTIATTTGPTWIATILQDTTVATNATVVVVMTEDMTVATTAVMTVVMTAMTAMTAARPHQDTILTHRAPDHLISYRPLASSIGIQPIVLYDLFQLMSNEEQIRPFTNTHSLCPFQLFRFLSALFLLSAMRGSSITACAPSTHTHTHTHITVRAAVHRNRRQLSSHTL